MSDKKTRNVKDKIQTVIFLCFLIIFPIFALAFCFYSQANHGFSEVLDKSFSVSIGVFGGAATLTAAYIASLLFNDWKLTHNKNIDSQLCIKAFDYIQNTEIELVKIRHFMLYYLNNNSKLNLSNELNKNLDSLTSIANITPIILSNLGFFIEKDTFNKKFIPEFEKIINDLDAYIKTVDTTFRFYQINENHEDFLQTYIELTETLRSRFRATFRELEEYYKALN